MNIWFFEKFLEKKYVLQHIFLQKDLVEWKSRYTFALATTKNG